MEASRIIDFASNPPGDGASYPLYHLMGLHLHPADGDPSPATGCRREVMTFYFSSDTVIVTGVNLHRLLERLVLGEMDASDARWLTIGVGVVGEGNGQFRIDEIKIPGEPVPTPNASRGPDGGAAAPNGASGGTG